ncbi:unnamed protein product [Caenorhabditis angaria]|uniref:BTB domain-containing protein n=1 Tax=Caenorhabditis angaria TaxID=860376 RepID=A0A9P1J0C3_9PELO|nr:unnamed protein product [Caenorhabditis angaria]
MSDRFDGIIKVPTQHPHFNYRNSNSASESWSVGNLPWFLSSKCELLNNKWCLRSVILSCDNESSFWECDAEVEISFQTTASKKCKHAKSQKLNAALNCLEFPTNVELSNIPTNNNQLTIQVSMLLKNITGFLEKRWIDFKFYNKSPKSDVTFVIDGTKLYANKTYLAIHSQVFESMFSSNFKEKSETVIALEDNLDDFVELLEFVYPCGNPINGSNYVGLMKLADKYAMTHVMYDCEKYLIETNEVNVIEKLVISNQYSLPKLQGACFKSFTEIKQIEQLKQSEEYDLLTDSTKAAILEKVFKLLKNNR